MENQISDSQLKDIALQHYNSDQVKEYNFPTETVPLPSKGLLYPKEHPLAAGYVDIKYMTAREEDILTSSNLIKQGKVIDKLLQSLIVTKVNYSDLYVGDKNAIMIAARILGYGKDYQVEIEDPFSTEKQTEVIDLQSIQDKEIDWNLIPDHENNFEFELPHAKRIVTFQLMTHGTEQAIQNELKTNALKKKDGIDREFSTRLKYLITSIDGDYDRKAVNTFVDNELFSLDSKALREYIQKVSPDVDLRFEFVSNVTGESMVMEIPMGASFFWPRA